MNHLSYINHWMRPLIFVKGWPQTPWMCKTSLQ